MNPYSLLASGAHLSGGGRLPENIHNPSEHKLTALDELVARRTLKSFNVIERAARRVLGRG